MNTASQHLINRLEQSLSVPAWNRATRRRAVKLANVAERRGLLRPEIVQGWPRVYKLAKSQEKRKTAAGMITANDLAGYRTLGVLGMLRRLFGRG